MGEDRRSPQAVFISRLAKEQGCPVWLLPVHYPMPEMAALSGEFVRVYEVIPEQSHEEAALRFGELMFDRGEHADAEIYLKEMVRQYPDYLPGWIMLAQVQLVLDHENDFQAISIRIAALQSGADALALDDRIGLATVLAVAGDMDGVRREIRRCVEAADEKNLRKLDANRLLWFAKLAQTTGEGLLRPELMQQVFSILPQEMSKQVQASSTAQ